MFLRGPFMACQGHLFLNDLDKAPAPDFFHLRHVSHGHARRRPVSVDRAVCCFAFGGPRGCLEGFVLCGSSHRHTEPWDPSCGAHDMAPLLYEYAKRNTGATMVASAWACPVVALATVRASGGRRPPPQHKATYLTFPPEAFSIIHLYIYYHIS
mgnify:CR=1 FL=1